MKNYLFDSITNVDFLFFAWLDLKKKFDSFQGQSSYRNFRPIDRSWFSKFSLLVRNNKLSYLNKKSAKLFYLKKSFIQVSRFSVWQNAILIVLLPLCEKYYGSKSKFIMECLRIFIN